MMREFDYDVLDEREFSGGNCKFLTIHEFTTMLPDRWAWRDLEEVKEMAKGSTSVKYIFKIPMWNEKRKTMTIKKHKETITT